ncbi:MAG: TonB-dependent receptor [Tannerella sp.]|nr:TonB-dependent receptor [Tannerella sp.]
MKLLTFFLAMGIGLVSASKTYSQRTLLTFNMQNKTVREVFDAIEHQSEFIFLYYSSAVEENRKVDIQVENQTINKVLDLVFEKTDNVYTIDERQVYIARINQPVPQQDRKAVKGKVTDKNGDAVPGATVQIVGSTRGVMTDENGVFELDYVSAGTKLSVSFIGMESQEVIFQGKDDLIVVLEEKVNELDEVSIVAFGKQRKESVISSISTVNVSNLRIPSSNLTTALSGRIAGMISYQTSGEPGYDNAEFFIRGITSFGTGKVDPLILIDNVEISASDLSRIHPDDIASFSILKDATATALYGARGANGVILVTTKEGREGKAKVSIRIENSFSSPTQKIEMADPITYMRLANEAARTRNPLAAIPYSNEQIDNTILGVNPYVYPAVDWMEMLTKDVAVNQRANLNISGGGTVARYYIAGSFSQDNGILKVDKRNNFNNNIDLKKYLIRSNININLTPSTEAVIRLHGTFDDYIGPIAGASDLYKKILKVSPVRFPAYFEPDENFSYAKHILFGGYGNDRYMNPYAEMVKGYRQESKSVMLAQLELKQNFDRWIKGLSWRILGNTTRNAAFDLSREYSPFYYQVTNYNRLTDKYLLGELNPESGNNYLVYTPGYKTVVSSFYAESSISYNRTFNKHGVSGMLVGIIRNSLTGNATTLSGSLPMRNLGLSGRFTYAFDDRYFSEFNFGYNGSEKFDAGHRWGFFPSFGVGWAVSNEQFWKESVNTKVISKFKIRGTYGLVGNDEIGNQRFFYLSQVNIGGGNSFKTGYEFGKTRSGVAINNYPNSEIGWEIAYKTNLGIELDMFKGKVEIIADLYHEHRINILQTRADIPTSMGLWSTPQANVGEANGKGVDISLDYNQAMGRDFWITARGNFTYARSVYDFYEEPDYSDMPWRSRKNMPISQQWGYVAERLFIDEADVRNSPRQDFGEYLPGDIKYKDINDDGVINEIDKVPIGRPTTPEINYGFGISAGLKSFDVSFFFQGSARSSFWINADAMSPFVQRTNGDGISGNYDDTKILETGLTKFIADDYWSEASQNPFMAWPRLSTYVINNNTQRSTWFMRNGDFIRLKSVEAGYMLPEKWSGKMRVEKIRFYLSATNLLLFSKFSLWDVEMGGNGLNYPLQRVVNIGLNVSF